LTRGAMFEIGLAMARPLRINVAGGWYHITSRGQNRQKIYDDARDRENFLVRLEEMTRRYNVEIHAYVLMPNHYHLIVRTPKANASEAMQWLNNGYGIWRNRRHRRTGHVFQGRFKGILVEGGCWVLELSRYIHFNPVAVMALGLGKKEKKAESLGAIRPPASVVRARLETLRSFRWSSYRAYAGYDTPPSWLFMGEVLGRVSGGRDGYRREAESRLRQGNEEALWSNLKWGVVLGSEKFAEKMRTHARVVRETHGRSEFSRQIRWEDVQKAVEQLKGEDWAAFVDRHGDWGRDLAFWIARRRGGMTLRELGERSGGTDYSAVSEAIRTFERKRLQSQEIRDARDRACHFLNLET
jgi:putative transposase